MDGDSGYKEAKIGRSRLRYIAEMTTKHGFLGDEEENTDRPAPTDYDVMNQKMLLNDIYCADCNNDMELLEISIRNFTAFLEKRELEPRQLIEHGTVEILMKRVVVENVFCDPVTRSSITCLYNLTRWSSMSEYLVQMGLVGVFAMVVHGTLSHSTKHAVCGLSNLAMDCIEVMKTLARDVPPNAFTALLGDHHRGIARLVAEAIRIQLLRPIAVIFDQFCCVEVERHDLEVILVFFTSVLKAEAKEETANGVFTVAMKGLYDMAANARIPCDLLYYLDSVIDIIEAARSCKREDLIALSCDCLSELLRIGVKHPELCIETVLSIGERCFDTLAGTAAFRLVQSVCENCEAPVLMMLCVHVLPLLSKGILDGSYQIKCSATIALIRVLAVTGTDLVGHFLQPELFTAMVSLLEIEDYQAQILEQFSLLFERSLISGAQHVFLELSETCGLHSALQWFSIESSDEIASFASQLLARIHETSMSLDGSQIVAV